MSGNNFPRVELTQDEQIWLEAAYIKVKNGARIDPVEMIVELWGKVSEDFEYKKFDRRLLKWGSEFTLLGVLHADPSSDVANKADEVIKFIRSLILTDSAIEEVTSQQISDGTGISEGEVAFILSLVHGLGEFWQGATRNASTLGYISITIRDEQVKKEYLKFKGIDQLLERHYKEYEPPEQVISNSIVMTFDFPVEVRVPCEQYLLYFGTFLQDLGVNATSDLKHEAGQVLFTVTPDNKLTALDKIRAALDVYLHLPSNPVSDTTNEAIAVQRLESNVLRLRSDLKLAAAELQAKNAAIQAHELTISVQKGLLSGEVIFASMKDVTPKDKDKEKLLGGIVALATYKDKGVEVNLAEIYRKLKGLFNKNENHVTEFIPVPVTEFTPLESGILSLAIAGPFLLGVLLLISEFIKEMITL